MKSDFYAALKRRFIAVALAVVERFGQGVPQRLKPVLLWKHVGTTEVVPFPTSYP